MATLTIRRLPDAVIEEIKRRAAAHGLSMEEEIRRFLVERYATREEVLERFRRIAARCPGKVTPEEAERISDEAGRWEGRGGGP